jgi:hypothetical protein
MPTVQKILEAIVAVQERITERYELLAQSHPDAVSDGELDEKELALLRARLELAQYLENRSKHGPETSCIDDDSVRLS